ncbi:PsbP domain-containing protein 1, chloroplastic [Glycine max]|nr:PsbP domain-containing protein 1, chloroplastic [Glycine max]
MANGVFCFDPLPIRRRFSCPITFTPSTHLAAPIPNRLLWTEKLSFLCVSSLLAKAFAVPRRKAMSLILSSYVLSEVGLALAQQSPVFREYIDAFDGCSFQYPGSWIQVRGAGADIFFRDPFVLDENLSVEIS